MRHWGHSSYSNHNKFQVTGKYYDETKAKVPESMGSPFENRAVSVSSEALKKPEPMTKTCVKTAKEG